MYIYSRKYWRVLFFTIDFLRRQKAVASVFQIIFFGDQMNFSVVFVLAPGTSEALHHIQLTN